MKQAKKTVNQNMTPPLKISWKLNNKNRKWRNIKENLCMLMVYIVWFLCLKFVCAHKGNWKCVWCLLLSYRSIHQVQFEESKRFWTRGKLKYKCVYCLVLKLELNLHGIVSVQIINFWIWHKEDHLMYNYDFQHLYYATTI